LTGVEKTVGFGRALAQGMATNCQFAELWHALRVALMMGRRVKELNVGSNWLAAACMHREKKRQWRVKASFVR